MGKFGFGCKHKAWLGKDPDGVRAIVLVNDDDAYYKQYFTDQPELARFIASLVVLLEELGEDEAQTRHLAQLEELQRILQLQLGGGYR